MNSTTAFRLSAAMGFLAVALGAFGAHGLKPLLAQNGTEEIWAKAASYHLSHAVVLLVLAALAGNLEANGGERKTTPLLAWSFFMAGILIFSGSLYALAITNIHRLGMITPIGGVSLLVGWAILVWRGR